MTLPDVDPCLSLGAEGWAALGRRLRAIGLTSGVLEPYLKLSCSSHESLRSPMVKWNLRRDPSPRAAAMRMFAFWDPVTPEEARGALGDELPLGRLLELGVLGETAGGGLVSRFVLRMVDDLYILSDDLNVGGEAVMGLGPTTEMLIETARPAGRIGRALDLGCGAGAIALALASTCDRVIATDISARAVALTRINAWLNGIVNVQARAGDLFAPVAGESFDLVLSQPPFVARDDEAAATTYLFGGARGDELVMKLLAGLGPHLAPGGTAALFVEWPMVEGDAPLEQRVREALGPSGDRSFLVVHWTDWEVDDHCARYTSTGHVWQDEAYERDAMRRRDHFERMKIRSVRPTLTLVRRNRGGGGWTSTVQGRRPERGPGVRGELDRLIRARDLLAQGDDAVRASRLRIADGVRFSAAGPDGMIDVVLPPDRLQTSLSSSEEAMSLVRAVAGAASVDAGITGSVEASDAADALEAVKEALRRGVLDV